MQWTNGVDVSCMIDIGISKSVHHQDWRMKSGGHIDGHLAGSIGHRSFALSVGCIEHFVVVGVCEDDEEDDSNDEENGC